MGKSWLAPLAVNVLLGIPGVVPIWLVYYITVNGPLSGLGLAGSNPTENDGVLPWLLIAAPILLLFGLIWWMANRPLRRRTSLPLSVYRVLSIGATALPTLALIIIS